MKRIRLLIISVMILVLTACGNSNGADKNKAQGGAGGSSDQNLNDGSGGGSDQNSIAGSGDISGQDSSGGSNVTVGGSDEEYMLDGVYVENVNCGYISTEPHPEQYISYLVINEADVEAAETKLGMKMPDGQEAGGEGGHIEAFYKVMTEYPLEYYVYLFIYQEYSSLGHNSHADGVVYKDGALSFHYDVFEGPDEDEAVCDAMDGEFKIAAIPKEAIMDKTIKKNVRPSRIENSDSIKFSEDTMFSLRVYEPWMYESLHYTLMSDGTLIVLYYDTELGREHLSDERMNAIREIFSPEKVYDMDIGIEDTRTDGISNYIILYDAEGNEIEAGGYELVGGDDFNHYFNTLYQMLEDDYTKQFSDKLDECAQEGVTYRDKYLSTP